MPIYGYLQFTPNSDDMNVPGSSDVTKPSEGWKGRDANDALRATNSALRNLGDLAAKLPLNPDGSINGGPNQGRVGTAAFLNAENFLLDTGVLGGRVRGSVGSNSLIMAVCSPSDVDALYQEQRFRGFDLCDGRRTTNPYPPFNVINPMPNFMGCFPWFADTIANVLQFRFGAISIVGAGFQSEEASRRLIQVGDHNHGDGLTGGFQLGYDQLPTVVTSVGLNNSGNIPSGGTRDVFSTTAGGNQSHSHPIQAGGAHNLDFNIRPPAIAVLPFLRVW